MEHASKKSLMLYMEIFLDMIQAMNEGRKCRFQVRTKLEHSKAELSFTNKNPQSRLIFPSFYQKQVLFMFNRFYKLLLWNCSDDFIVGNTSASVRL